MNVILGTSVLFVPLHQNSLHLTNSIVQLVGALSPFAPPSYAYTCLNGMLNLGKFKQENYLENQIENYFELKNILNLIRIQLFMLFSSL